MDEIIEVSKYYSANIQWTIPSKLRIIKSLIPNLQDHIKPLCDYYKSDSYGIASSLFEAIRNAIVYGNLELDPELKNKSVDRFNDLIKEREVLPEYGDRKVFVRGEVNADYIKFEVEDQGSGFDTKTIPQFDESMKTLPVGRGLFIMNSNMDSVSWNESGNCITMTKAFKNRS